MATTVRVERRIAAPAEEVWALVSDITRMGEWSPETTGGTWTKGATGPAVGARFKGTNEVGKKSWSTACRVNECEPGRTFGFLVTGLGSPVAQWTYEIEPDGDGCVVTESWTDRRNWLLLKASKSVSGVADRESHNRAGMEQTLAALAAVAEAS